MRLKPEIINFLKTAILGLSPQAKVYLFGSRSIAKTKGGDIDILVLSPQLIDLKELRKIKVNFYKEFGEQKLDLINFTFEQDHSFKALILEKAIEL